MPRKVDYGVDYDDYEDYEDYDDYGELEETVEAPETKQSISRPGQWSCSICTYDNDEGMSACDICGVIRNPKPGNYKNNDRKVDAFKFDVPSPDDQVVYGLHSSKKGSRGINERTAAINARSTSKFYDNDPSIMAKGKQVNQDEITYARDRVGIVTSNSECLDRFSSVPNSGSNGMNQTNSSKDTALRVQSFDEMSENSSASMPKGKHKRIDDSSSSLDGGSSHKLASELNTISISDKSRNSSTVNARKTKSRAQYQPEKWMLPVNADKTVTQLNLAIVGHVDSGKSTLTGRLLHFRGRITQKQMHKYEKEAKLQGKGSFAYAWALDESPEERERGITMTVAVAYFDSSKYHVVVLDSPGHKDFVPNMISGATQADAAILVIDASIGAFEAGMDGKKGQTREHAQLIRSFGVDQIIVAINKMDAVGYSNNRFDFIKAELTAFLRPCGFKDSSVSWIPLSVMENQNLVSAPSDDRLLSWYNGPCLLDAIDNFQPPSRDYSKPLLMPICDVIKLSSTGQVSASGKLEAGAIRTGFKVLVMPSGDIGTVRTLERDSEPCSIARAGDNVVVSVAGIEGNNVIPGGVLCHPDFPVAIAKHLELQILILDFATPILVGSQLEFHLYHAKEAARVSRIVSLLDPKTGKVTKKAPRCLAQKQKAAIEVVLNAPICVEEFSNCKALGRVALRVLGRTIALGIVTRIIEDQE